MPRSQANNRTFPLVAGGTFTGTAESTAAGVAISVSVLVPTECTLTIEQSYDKATWFISEQYPIPANAHKTVQQAVGLEYFRVILLNNGITQTFCHLISTLSTSLTQNVNIRNLEASRDTVDISGNVEVNFPAVQDISGSVSVLNFPALQDISGTVLCFGLDSTNPPATTPIHIRDERLLVDVSGSVIVSNFPAVQDVSGSVIASNLPLVTVASTEGVRCKIRATRVGDSTTPDSSIISYASQGVDNLVSLQIADPSDVANNDLRQLRVTDLSGNTSLISIDSKITACNTHDISGSVVIPHLNKTTDSVDISGQTVVTSHTTSSVTSWENPTQLISFDSGNTVRQIKGSPGTLHSVSITNDNNTLAYVALYNELAANVVLGTTPTIGVFTINKNQQIQLPLHAVAFSTAISFFAATAYAGGIAQTGVYLTASYNS